uniref:Small ribosomal subunit protein uS11c n=1 Tax=Pseudochlorodesmis sp. HV01306c TaxID=2358490 RepID=A0A386AYG6_9CHLO|nr:ribosomal protein S11 [Pseudochlorodesmis sp. HV01306c]
MKINKNYHFLIGFAQTNFFLFQNRNLRTIQRHLYWFFCLSGFLFEKKYNLHNKKRYWRNSVTNGDINNLESGINLETSTKMKFTDRLIIHIKATFNNTLMTLTDSQGQVLIWVSAGSCGLKGARKGTPFAAKKVVEIFIKKSTDYFVKCNQIKICVYGIGPGRESALRGLEKIGYTKRIKQNLNKTKLIENSENIKTKQTKSFSVSNKITLIREMTKIPHNGCRSPKKRRL